MDAKEQRRKRDRERYARMSDEEKQKMLKKRREAYKHSKTKELEARTEKCTEEGKEEMLKKHRDAYMQKKRKEPKQRTKICAKERQKYANMEPEQKKARIDQIKANKILRRNRPCKESVAMVNLPW
jgi:hypothetical protein